jgi:hypothetical protein
MLCSWTHLEALQPHRGRNIPNLNLCHRCATADCSRCDVAEPMELLGYGDDSEGDESNGPREADPIALDQIHNRWAEADDESDQSDLEMEAKEIERKRIEEQQAQSGLISVADLLEKEIHCPSYLKSNEPEEYQVEITATK